ncbi:hypothetical protein [uncultured Ruminococcus sp.]|uniref:hypothetical protein n=1 Tax=uncultured Ruminococcus sp. TaxID=165186 RepID=UPI00266663B4|nr:hypothetical protein [uncultured Ruminococcus sp.]
MKKAITILAICSLLLTACGQIDDTESKSETTTAIASESTAGEDTAETSSAKEEKDTSEATTTTKKSSQTVSSSSKPTGTIVTTTKKSISSGASGNSVQGQNNSVQNNNGQENNYQPEQNSQQTYNSPSNNDQSNNGAQQNNQSSENKPQITTAKPAVTNPPTTTTPRPQTEPPAPEPTEEERYMGIGRNLLHDGSDYSKAEAVYNWMTENGSGTCVNYSYKTYLICQGIGLDCYACWTDSGIYGHVANIVKVDGIWYVLDTQAGAFLDYNYGFTEVVDIDENHIADGSMISDYSYEELHE